MIDIKPEIGGKAYAVTPIMITDTGLAGVAWVDGEIINIENDLYEIKDFDSYKFPLYRIEIYTFGGIDVINYAFDPEKIFEEDQKIAKSKGIDISRENHGI